MSHLVDRFASAVRALVDDAPIKQRLIQAYADHLADIKEAELPPDLREQFLALQDALTRVAPAGRETRLKASVQKMSGAEAAAHAAAVTKLFGKLCAAASERAEPLKVVAQSSKPPRYLAQRP
jgi:hypothetical protein